MTRIHRASPGPLDPPRRPRGIVPLLLAALAVGLFAGSGQADPVLDPRVSPAAADALKAASYYTAGQGQMADLYLKLTGYEPKGIGPAAWRDVPAVHMLETAYLAAEAHPGAPGGGERFLALLSKTMAQQYEAAGLDPALKPYVELANKERIKSVPFGDLARAADKPPPELPGKVKAAIDAIVQYSEGGGIGLRSVLVDHMNLDPPAAYEIMRTAQSHEEALRRGLAQVPEPRRQFVLEQVVSALDANFENATKERAFDPFRGPNKGRAGLQPRFPFRGDPGDPSPPRPEDGPRGGGPRDGGPRNGGRPGEQPRPRPSDDLVRRQWQQDRASDYQKFVERSYRPPSRPIAPAGPVKFRGGIRGGRGFGGVVIGNDVSDTNLPAVKRLTWRADDKAPETGTLTVTFADGEARLDRIRIEDAFAAHVIYYQAVPGLDEKATVGPAAHDDLIGLVGIGVGNEQVEYFECGPERIVNRGSRRPVVMHPGVATLDLGWSILMCDILPFPELQRPVIEAVRQKAGAKVADRLRVEWNASKATWKVSDVPLRIGVEKGTIVIERPEEVGRKFDVDLRRAAFITLNSYRDVGDDDLIPESGDDFYPLVPHLVAASADYERLNDFARVAAVVRWAKSRGAEFAAPPAPPAPPARSRAASVIITQGGATPAPAFDKAGAREDLLKKVRLRTAVLQVKRPELVAIRAKMGGPAGEEGDADRLLAEAYERTQPALVAKLRGGLAQLGRFEEARNQMLESKKTVRAAEGKGLPKDAGADRAATYADIQEEVRKALFGTPEESERAVRRRTEFEKEHLPEVHKARLESEKREKDFKELMGRQAEYRGQVESAAKELCPEYRYWRELWALEAALKSNARPGG